MQRYVYQVALQGQLWRQLQEEDWSKIETRSLNSQVRFRNYRMKINCMNESKDFQDAESAS